MARKNKSDGRPGDQFNGVEEKPYRVGCSRSPTETQFKPGILGNPNGRNKKAPDFSGVIEQVLDEKIELRIGDACTDNGNQQPSRRHKQLHSAAHPEHRL